MKDPYVCEGTNILINLANIITIVFGAKSSVGIRLEFGLIKC